MALLKCKECGKEISDKAAACPHCGCKLSQNGIDPRGKPILWLYGIGVAVFCIGAFLFMRSFVTILVNMNDWYFWNWGTQGDEAIRNVLIGGVMLVAGFSAGMLAYKAAMKIKKEKEDNELQDES